jgi:hypothetical protein
VQTLHYHQRDTELYFHHTSNIQNIGGKSKFTMSIFLLPDGEGYAWLIVQSDSKICIYVRYYEIILMYRICISSVGHYVVFWHKNTTWRPCYRTLILQGCCGRVSSPSYKKEMPLPKWVLFLSTALVGLVCWQLLDCKLMQLITQDNLITEWLTYIFSVHHNKGLVP